MAHLDVDRTVCEAYGNCVIAAPDYFDIDEDEGLVILLKDEVAPDDIDAVTEAMRSCPVQAINLVDPTRT